MEKENESLRSQWMNPKNILIFLSVILLFAVIIVAILKDRIVDKNLDVTTITGQGEISYNPDIAVITVGVEVDRAFKAEEALNKLNDSVDKVVSSIKSLGIPEGDIQTKSYSLLPHYDYQGAGGGVSVPSGYDANQQIAIKVKDIDSNPGLISNVIESASRTGANQIIGVSFNVSNLEELKQKARLEAINDAKLKSASLAKAAGIEKLGKVTGWYENVLKSPDLQNSGYGAGGASDNSGISVPQIPAGTDEIIIEVGLNFRVK
jgi:uncharacterized protein